MPADVYMKGDVRPPDGLVIDGKLIPYACPMCNGTSELGFDYPIPCPECEDGLNSALQWYWQCGKWENVQAMGYRSGGDIGTSKDPFFADICTVCEEAAERSDCRWVAIGLASGRASDAR